MAKHKHSPAPPTLVTTRQRPDVNPAVMSRRGALRDILGSALTGSLMAGFSMGLPMAAGLAGALSSGSAQASENPSVKADDGVIKMITLLHRKPGMTREQFIERYEAVHRKIGEKYLKAYAIRYVRRYTMPAGPERVGDVELPADVVMEIWFPDQATFETCMASLMTDDAQAEIVADELEMFDRSRMVSFMVEEYESDLENV